MSEKITALLEAIVSKKPADAREVFDSIMVEKLRSVVESHRDVVAENLFADHKADEELDEEFDYYEEGLDEEELTEGRKRDLDPHGVTELTLHADNSEHLYNGHRQHVIANLLRHAKRSLSNPKKPYDRERAVDAVMHHMHVAADDYARAHGGLGETGRTMFSPATKRKAAEQIESDIHDDHIAPFFAQHRK